MAERFRGVKELENMALKRVESHAAREEDYGEAILAKLREAEVELAWGKKVSEAAKKIGVTE